MNKNCSWRGYLNAVRARIALRAVAHAVRAHRRAPIVLVLATAIVPASLLAVSLHRPGRLKVSRAAWPPPTARALALPPPSARDQERIRLVIYRYLMHDHHGGLKYYFLGISGYPKDRDPSPSLIRALRAPGIVAEPESRMSRWDAAYRDQQRGANIVTINTGGIHWTDDRTVEVDNCNDEIMVRGGSGYYLFGGDDDFMFRIRRGWWGQWSIQRLKIVAKSYFLAAATEWVSVKCEGAGRRAGRPASNA